MQSDSEATFFPSWSDRTLAVSHVDDAIPVMPPWMTLVALELAT